MIHSEPTIHVGIIEKQQEIRGIFHERYRIHDDVVVTGEFRATVQNGKIVLMGGKDIRLIEDSEIICSPLDGGKFLLHDVIFGINFHWERREDQVFQGALRLIVDDDGMLTAVNEIEVEQYLASVISSEMSANAPIELLKAHAITSRSWLVAMLEMRKTFADSTQQRSTFHRSETQWIKWYDREDHSAFDVCADDHCQRYQGVTKIISESVQQAVEETRGIFVTHEEAICDARFYKACGGITEEFHNAWSDEHPPYLRSISDSAEQKFSLHNEEEAAQWINSSPDVFCNTTDGDILRQVLPSFDQETTDFFRWTVSYTQSELSSLVRDRSGIDFGTITDLQPVERGPSGRIVLLRITGTKCTLIVGKELEIRKWLSKSHLYSSAFIVEKSNDSFTLRGAGWGHGVGLCQIGAAVMAVKGYSAEAIVQHYFPGALLRKLY